MPAHADAVPPGGQRVAQLVQQHRAEQADDEAEADEVAGGLRQVELAARTNAPYDHRDQQREQQPGGVR